MDSIKIPASTQNIAMVEPYIEQMRQKHQIGDDVFGNILISLTEAVNNAIIHGCNSDESKFVEVSCERKDAPNMVVFKIMDEGDGFDYNQLPDPTSPENLEKITGRGVFLMKQLADWVIFEDEGSTVEIQFKI